MNATRARRLIRGLARAGRWRFAEHAEERMIERDAAPEDVYEVLKRAAACRKTDSGRWRLDGWTGSASSSLSLSSYATV